MLALFTAFILSADKMLLNNVTLVETGKTVSIQIKNDLITSVSDARVSNDSQVLNFENAIVFQGLINSHDHLDFNLFPQLGDRFYNSYTEWGNYIHQHYKPEIEKVLKIPIELREQWGMIKNLLGGVTTVVNHGEPVKTNDRLINVFENYQFIHSVQFEKQWKCKLNNPLKRRLPLAIHVGEGKDEAAHREIDQLIKWNYLHKELIGVHGVAMDEKQAESFKALVWCPQSNYYLLDKTANVKRLKDKTTILFGTDSTLTSNWDIWDHIKLARKTEMLTDEELYQSVTKNATQAWKLPNKSLAPAHSADLVIVKQKNPKALTSFFETDPQDILLVMVNGDIKLIDSSLRNQLGELGKGLYGISLNGSEKYIMADVPQLIHDIHQYYPAAKFPVSAL